MIRARCPECSQEVVVRGGRFIRHHGTQMRFSGARWFRTTCRGSGRAVLHPTGDGKGQA